MLSYLHKIRHSLVFKLILILSCICLLAIATWAFYTLNYQRKKSIQDITDVADRISKTIRLGTHYAMMLNSRDDINQIIQNVAKQKGIENIRIYNKHGQINFSNILDELNLEAHLESEACCICHRQDPPLANLDLTQRTRIVTQEANQRLLGIITPIYNEPGCSSGCHFHDPGAKVLGALDVVISLKETDAEITRYEQSIVLLAVAIFIVPSLFIFGFVYRFVIKPISQLTEETKNFITSQPPETISTDPESEVGRLLHAFHEMRRKILEHHQELIRQKDEYQNLFERVPCLITVQDKAFRLINYNREFKEKYNPSPGEHCYQAYKSRTTKCENCPVEKTFKDGKTHYSEEKGMNRDGTMGHWLVRTSPVKNASGKIIAAMEISLDITERKKLEQQAEQSEKKYHAIFNNIPNPVFVLDYESLTILDLNDKVTEVYGYTHTDILGKEFIILFEKNRPKEIMEADLRNALPMNSVQHLRKDGKLIFVDIWISLSEYPGQKVLLATTSDITERLETEAQLNQAAKLTTLGEMATGVAHELNQPLSVIKTASSFCLDKIARRQEITQEILQLLLTKIDTNVDRASKIISHMRDFARKSDIALEPVSIQEVLEKAYDIFSQQLKVRGIHVLWDVSPDLPFVLADPGRLEQVFINLLINSRDAIETREKLAYEQKDLIREITIAAHADTGNVIVEISDTGTGIPQDIAEKIFQPFFTTKEVGKGTGLGLSISYGIIRECSGNIKIKETSEKGTTFQITLPAHIHKEVYHDN